MPAASPTNFVQAIEHGSSAAAHEAADQTQSAVSDHALRHFIAQLADDGVLQASQAEFIARHIGGLPGAVVSGMLDTSSISTEEQYNSSAANLARRFARIRELYSELGEWSSGRPARGRDLILADIRSESVQAVFEFDTMKKLTLTIEQERMLGDRGCYDTLDAKTQIMGKETDMLMATYNTVQ